MADAGFKIVVEGEKEFKTAIREINEVIKVNKSELKLLSEQYKVSEQPMETLKYKQKSLSDAMEFQAEKSRKIADEMEKASAAYGDHDARVMDLVKSYNESETELARLQGEYNKTTESISSAESAMSALAEMQADIDESNDKFRQTLGKVNSEIASVSSEMEKSGKRYGDNKAQIDKLDKSYDELSRDIEVQKKNISALTENLQNAEKVYGENSKETEAYRKQLNDATTALDDMSAAAEENRTKVDELTKDNGGFGDMLGTVKDIAGKLGIDMPKGLSDVLKSVGDVTSGFGTWSGAIGAAGAALKLVKSMNEELIETADKYKNLYTEAQQLGVDTTEYQKLQYAMQMTGVASSELEGLFNALNGKIKEVDTVIGDYAGNMGELKYATEDEQKAVADAMKEWDQYGVALYDQNGELRDTIDIFYDIIDVFDDYSNKTERITKLQGLFGESASKLNPAIDAGAVNIRKFADEAEAAGIIIDDLAMTRMYSMSTAAEVQSKKMEVLSDKWKIFIHDLFDFGNWGSGNLSQSASSFFKQYVGGKLGGFAAGTSFSPEGWARVGENGPEIVHLPRGSEVFPTGVIPRELAGGGSTVNNYNITIPASDVKEFNDIVRIVQGANMSLRRG